MELSFGEQVKILLKRKNMTIKQLAEMIEEQTGMRMSRQNLTQRLTRDNFQEQDMRLVAAVLGCSVQLSLTEKSDEEIQAAAALRETERSVDIKKAVDHQLTIEEVIKAAGKEPMLKAAEEKAIREAEAKAYEEARAREEAKAREEEQQSREEVKPSEPDTGETPQENANTAEGGPKRRITVRDLANRAREDRLRREAQLMEEARRRSEIKEEESRKREELRAAEEARRMELKAVEEAHRAAAEQAAEEAQQARLAEQKAKEEREQAELAVMTEEEKAARAEEEKLEKERIRDIARRALERTRSFTVHSSASDSSSDVPDVSFSDKAADPADAGLEQAESAEIDDEASVTDNDGYTEHDEEIQEDISDIDMEADDVNEPVQNEDESVGEINPWTGEEYESNVVRTHPKLVGFIQVYDRGEHKWIDMTEWAFMGFQERKKVMLGSEYEPPTYLD